MSDRKLAWHLLLAALGLNIALHGLTRLPHLGTFVDDTAKLFTATILPDAMVRAYCYVLPVLEAALGLWLLSARATRWSLVAGALMMMSLELGTALRSDWNTLGAQMVYSLLYFVLLYTRP